MFRQRWRVRARAVVIPLLPVAGAALWTIPQPHVDEVWNRIEAKSLLSQVLAEHNTNSSRKAQSISALEHQELVKASMAVVAKRNAACQAICTSIWLFGLARVAAVCCWLTASLALFVHLRTSRKEPDHGATAGSGEQVSFPEDLACRVPAAC